jgi:tricorn protease
VFLYDTKTSKVLRITDRYTNDTEPVWDPDGKYLYFLSDRTINPLLGENVFGAILDKTSKPYLVILKKGEKSPFFAKEPEELDEEAKGDGDEKEGKDHNGDEEKTKAVEIDLDGLMDRVVEFPVDAGHYSQLAAAEGKVFYRSRPSVGMAEGQRRGSEAEPMHSVHMFDLEEKEDEVIIPGINSYRLSYDGKKIAYRRGDSYHVVDAAKQGPQDDGDDKSVVDLSRWHIRLDPRQEWQQMFNEAWRLQRDFYWAPNMAGIDWAGIKVQYGKLLPKIATRAELNDLIGQMIAELSTSHTYIWGGDEGRPQRIPVGLLGALVEAEERTGRYKLVKIYPQEPSSPDAVSPLTLSHAGVEEGEYVLAVNGRPLDTSTNFYSVFLDLADDEVLLTVNARPTMDGARDVIVKTIGDDEDLRYLDWVRSKREYVDQATDGRVGYVHIPNMSTAGLVEFWRTFYPQLEKPGLIIDARYNGGGFVSELIIERLSVHVLAYGKARKGKPYRYPDEAVDAHLVALCNQEAGSDGDIFARAFKLAQLGTVIGMRTWGGVVGIRMDKPFVDGGMMTIPEFAWWERDGGWTLENWGAVPDIELENMPGDVLRGHDSQLERAVTLLNGELETDPRSTPKLPPFPDKSKK